MSLDYNYIGSDYDHDYEIFLGINKPEAVSNYKRS